MFCNLNRKITKTAKSINKTLKTCKLPKDFMKDVPLFLEQFNKLNKKVCSNSLLRKGKYNLLLLFIIFIHIITLIINVTQSNIFTQNKLVNTA